MMLWMNLKNYASLLKEKICINVIILKLGIVEHKVMEYQKFFENMDKSI